MTDQKLERLVSSLLRAGVVFSGVLMLIGGIYYVAAQGEEAVNYQHFQPQPAADRVFSRILAGAIALQARSIIQLGVLALVATPVARVILALAGFVLEKDRTYVVVTAIVLALLLCSLISG